MQVVGRFSYELLKSENGVVLVRARPSALRALAAEPRVRSIRCAARRFASPSDGAWRSKVDADVRS
jgi:hypothetical protein